MSIIGIILMWVWFVTAYAIVSKWPMGKEFNRRRTYWVQFEGK